MLETVYSIDILRVFQAIILVSGLLILYFGARNYGKSRSGSFLFFLLGFVFVTIGTGVAGFLFESLNYDLLLVEVIQSGSIAIGVLLILFSIVRRRD